jgi:hypothetical protein
VSGLAAYARIYLGVHTLNQVIFGFLLGIWLAFFCHFGIRNKLNSMANALFDRTRNPSDETYLTVIFWTNLCSLGIFIMGLTLYAIIDANIKNDPLWIENIIE